jgi:hypothetical protein
MRLDMNRVREDRLESKFFFEVGFLLVEMLLLGLASLTEGPFHALADLFHGSLGLVSFSLDLSRQVFRFRRTGEFVIPHCQAL